ncbi:MAG: HU family DNA-binding protein [Bacteroidota bacterium]|nr:HU family DNA-binding protein [Bacteroidota bacterium]
MRKADIINKVSLETGIDKSDVQETIEATIITIKKALVEGEGVFIRGFGSFVNKKRAKKIARNISTNTAIILEAHYIPSFKPSKKFIKSVKENNKIIE